MKRSLLGFMIAGFLLSFAGRAGAETEGSLNFFCENLSPHGGWIGVDDYGYCFQPNVAVVPTTKAQRRKNPDARQAARPIEA
jgi:hypothetical protein